MTNFEIDAAYIGDTPVEKIYLGAEVIYEDSPTPVDYRSMPLTIKALEPGLLNVNVSYNDVQVSRDGGDTWDYLSIGTTGITVSAGDELQFAGTPQNINTPSVAKGLFSGNTLSFDVYGNIESLEYGTYVDGSETSVQSVSAFTYCFFRCRGLHSAENLILPATALTQNCCCGMFGGCTSLTTTPVLSATTLAEWCYYDMFANCTALTTAPVLPATTLASSCYRQMFQGCTSLATAPVLPATTLASNCYESMFSNCTGLTTAPVLSATTLASSCYEGMFRGCTSLTTAPVLSATTLADYCYSEMFGDCTSLTTAPVLSATTLAESCYGYMFYNCTNLNYVKCLATSFPWGDETMDWLDNVSPTGTFVKASGATGWSRDASGIPSGWTVQNA